MASASSMIANARCSIARRYCSLKSGCFASHTHTVLAVGIFVGPQTARRLLPLAMPAQISAVSFWLYMFRRIGFRLGFVGGRVLLRVRSFIRAPPDEKQKTL